MDKTRLCFVIAPIGQPKSDERIRSDQVLMHIIKPAAEACGYHTIRADEISEPGLITSQVIQQVVTAPLVIADLTGRNPNVFYELALRHAVKKPVVQIIHDKESIPFDVAATRTVQMDHHDLDSAARAKTEIVRLIQATEQNPDQVDTPISVAIDLQFLRQSENPLEKSNAEIMSMLQELSKGMDQILAFSRDAAEKRKQTEWMDRYAPLVKQIFPLLDMAMKTPELQVMQQALERLGTVQTIGTHVGADGSTCTGTEGKIVHIGAGGVRDTVQCTTCSARF